MPKSNSQTVIGVFRTKEQARMAADHLSTNGFDRSRIDLSNHGEDIAETDHEKTDSFFTNLLGKDPHGVNYREAARRGTVVTVHTTEMKDAERAAAIMDEHGALNVADPEYAATKARATGTTDTADTGKAIPVIEENLEVGKKEVNTGGVRVHSRIVERPVEENLRLREEHVNIERHAVDRPASRRDLDSVREGETKITERAEVPVVNKQARVVEEVNIGKKTTEHTETVRDTVRKTDVEVDKIDPDKDRTRNK